MEITTLRLRLRRWRESDKIAFADMNSDPNVMEHFPNVLSQEESDAMFQRIQDHFEKHGFGLWAIEVLSGAPFIGFTGLAVPAFDTHFTPCVEIGWRIAYPYWNQGYATEAAKAVLEYAFTQLKLKEIVSFTVPANIRSRAVMEKIGMQYNPEDDFDHPRLPVGHPLRRHVLYRVRKH